MLLLTGVKDGKNKTIEVLIFVDFRGGGQYNINLFANLYAVGAPSGPLKVYYSRKMQHICDSV
jgi:hypothetical protein